jgi:hypothetical protein
MGKKPHQKIVGMPGEKVGEYDARKTARAPGATRRGVAPDPIRGWEQSQCGGLGAAVPIILFTKRRLIYSHIIINNHIIYFREQKKTLKNGFVLARFVFCCNVIFRNGVDSSIPGNVGHPKLGEEPKKHAVRRRYHAWITKRFNYAEHRFHCATMVSLRGVDYCEMLTPFAEGMEGHDCS